MIDRYLIRYFLAVMDHGNFSRAANLCGVTQPTLSIGIAKLEALVGHVLFNRTNRRVELTAMGVIFAAHARKIEADFALAIQAMREDKRSKLIRIGVIPTISNAWIERAATAARQAEGEKIELVEGRMRDLLPRLERGRLDVVLGILGNDSRGKEHLFEEDYGLALANNHPLATENSIAPEQVADADMLVRRNCEALADVSRFFTQRGIRPFFAARTTNEDRAAAYVRAGIGITVMPRSLTQHGISFVKLAGFEQRRRVGFLEDSASISRLAGSGALDLFTRSIRDSAGDASSI